MKTGQEFIQRMKKDREFREKVHACSDRETRLAFLHSQGYDFTPFIQIIDNMSPGTRVPGSFPASPCRPRPRKNPAGFWGRLGRLWRTSKAPGAGR
jgi:hypothetical protein